MIGSALVLAFGAGLVASVIAARLVLARHFAALMRIVRAKVLEEPACAECGRRPAACGCEICGTPCGACPACGRGAYPRPSPSATAILAERRAAVAWLLAARFDDTSAEAAAVLTAAAAALERGDHIRAR